MRLKFPPYVLSILFVYISIFFQACHPEKRLSSLVYFNQQGDSTLSKMVQNAEPLIQPGDRLSIIVNALDPASAAPYNLGSSGPASGLTSASAPSHLHTLHHFLTVHTKTLYRIYWSTFIIHPEQVAGFLALPSLS